MKCLTSFIFAEKDTGAGPKEVDIFENICLPNHHVQNKSAGPLSRIKSWTGSSSSMGIRS